MSGTEPRLVRPYCKCRPITRVNQQTTLHDPEGSAPLSAMPGLLCPSHEHVTSSRGASRAGSWPAGWTEFQPGPTSRLQPAACRRPGRGRCPARPPWRPGPGLQRRAARQHAAASPLHHKSDFRVVTVQHLEIQGGEGRQSAAGERAQNWRWWGTPDAGLASALGRGGAFQMQAAARHSFSRRSNVFGSSLVIETWDPP